MKRSHALSGVILASAVMLAGCSHSAPASSVKAAPVVAQKAVRSSPSAPIASSTQQSPNKAVCASFSVQSAAYQAPQQGSNDGPSAVAASKVKFFDQLSADAAHSTGAVQTALTSMQGAFADYMAATQTGEATQAEISALNSAGSAVNAACGH